MVQWWAPCNAGGMGLIPGQGTMIPHAAEQLSPQATATEFMYHSYNQTQPNKCKEIRKNFKTMQCSCFHLIK